MCFECDIERTHHVFLCVPCRKVWKKPGWFVVDADCPGCGESGKNMGTKWRAPKLSNTKAWKLIEAGDYLWDKRAIARNRKAQVEQERKDHWEWVKAHSKPGSIIPNNFRRKFL